MQDRTHKPVKDTRLIVRIDSEFADQIDRLAFRRFEGERSRLVREAIRKYLAEAEIDAADREVVAA